MITREQFAEEERRIEQLRREGHGDKFIQSWLRKWREVGRKI